MIEYGVTGTSSGLGGGLKRIIGAVPISRIKLKKYKNFKFDTLIHSGFERYDKNKNPLDYQQDALDLAKILLDLNYKKFVFISSVECNDIGVTTPYSEAKKMVEDLIISRTNNYVILRLPSLYGKEMRLNQIYRIATERKPKLTLSGESTFSLIQYEDVADFIRTKNHSPNIHQIFSECISLNEIAKYFSKSPIWGKYEYQTMTPSGIKPIYSKEEALEKYEKFIRDKNAK